MTKRPGRKRKIPLFSEDYRHLLNQTSAAEFLIVTSPRFEPPYPPGEISGPAALEEVHIDSGKKKEPTCLSCQVAFQCREEQVQHYQLDWHRYNLKRCLKGLSSVQQDQFERTADGISSISGSESDSTTSSDDKDDKGTNVGTARQSTVDKSPHLYFHLGGQEGHTYFLFHCIMSCYHSELSGSNLYQVLWELGEPQVWIILMRSGGHFAGAVFRGAKVVVHKTFHRYTVRAKRGTTQSVRDSQQGGHVPKSAGASLRRYNETALEAEIRNLVGSWASYVRESSCIFLRIPKYCKGIFVGDKGLFSRDDPRLRQIPFPTRRPTFREVCSTHGRLATLYVGGESQTGIGQSELQETGGEGVPGEVGGGGGSGGDGKGVRGGEEAEVEREGEREEERQDVPIPNSQGMRKKQKQKKQVGKEQNKPVAQVATPTFIQQLLLLAASGAPLQDPEEKYSRVLQEAGLRPIGTYSNDAQQPETYSHGAQQPETYSHGAQQPETYSHGAQQPETYSHDAQQPETYSHVAQQPETYSHDVQQPETYSHDVQQPETYSHDVQQPETYSHGAQQPETYSHDVQQPETYLRDAQQPETYSRDAQQPETYSHDVQQPETYLHDAQQPEIYSRDAQQPETYSHDVQQPETYLHDAQQPETYSHDTQQPETYSHDAQQPEEASLKHLNTTWNENTVLHTAAISGHLCLIPILLLYGADPAVRNVHGHTPYCLSRNKDVRDSFRRFMARYPTAWDYEAAHIPSPLTEEMERERSKRDAERRKAKKKNRAIKQRERAEKEEMHVEENAAKCCQRQISESLSKRDKQAMAAERRMAGQLPTSSSVLSAGVCSGCSQALVGLVPFERLDYKYCSMECLRQHRTLLTLQQK